MKVFENVEIEFFDMTDARQRPNDQEEVLIVLKDGSSSQRVSYRRSGAPSGKQRLSYATFKAYKTVPCKFVDGTQYLTNTYKLDEVICWGRLKTN